MTTFKTLILNQLKLAGVAKQAREPIYEIGFPLFREAFTHESFRSSAFASIHDLRAQRFTMEELAPVNLVEIDAMPNYNQLEFLGDKELNTCLAKHILKRWPTISDRNLTFSFQIVSAEGYLAQFAEKQGFFDHIIMSPYYRTQATHWKNGQQELVDAKVYQKGQIYNIFAKLLEDTCESFSAALIGAIDKYSEMEFGPGMSFLNTWSAGIVEQIDFDPMDDDAVQAIGMRMKEMWENIYAPRDIAFKFTKHNMYRVDEANRQPGHVPVAGVDPVTAKVIATAIGVSEKDAFKKVSRLVVDWLLANRAEEIEAGKKFKEQRRNDSSFVSRQRSEPSVRFDTSARGASSGGYRGSFRGRGGSSGGRGGSSFRGRGGSAGRPADSVWL